MIDPLQQAVHPTGDCRPGLAGHCSAVRKAGAKSRCCCSAGGWGRGRGRGADPHGVPVLRGFRAGRRGCACLKKPPHSQAGALAPCGVWMCYLNHSCQCLSSKHKRLFSSHFFDGGCTPVTSSQLRFLCRSGAAQPALRPVRSRRPHAAARCVQCPAPAPAAPRRCAGPARAGRCAAAVGWPTGAAGWPRR